MSPSTNPDASGASNDMDSHASSTMTTDGAADPGKYFRSRTSWPRLTDNSPTTVGYPFLQQRDPRDRELMSQVMTLKPYAAGYTNKGKAWTELARTLSMSETKDGIKLFPKGISEKACKERFQRIVQTLENAPANSPGRLGCDDDDHNSFHQLMEDGVEMFVSWRDGDQKGKGKEKEKEKHPTDHIKDEEIAHLLHQGKTGEPPRHDIRDIIDNDRKKAKKSASILLLREESQKIKLELKRKAQALEEEKFLLEKDRWEEEKKDRQAQREAQSQSIQLMAGLVGILKDLKDKK